VEVARAGAGLQLGAGIRTDADIERWLAAGVTRVILGTRALRDPAFVDVACRRWPGRIVVGIDARAGRVAARRRDGPVGTITGRALYDGRIDLTEALALAAAAEAHAC